MRNLEDFISLTAICDQFCIRQRSIILCVSRTISLDLPKIFWEIEIINYAEKIFSIISWWSVKTGNVFVFL